MSMELASFVHKLAIDGVFLFPLNGYDNRLIHLVGNDFTYTLFS